LSTASHNAAAADTCRTGEVGIGHATTNRSVQFERLDFLAVYANSRGSTSQTAGDHMAGRTGSARQVKSYTAGALRRVAWIGDEVGAEVAASTLGE